MDKDKAKKIERAYNVARAAIVALVILLLLAIGVTAQAAEANSEMKAASDYLPEVHGTIRGKLEYQPAIQATRFEVRNARVSIEGLIPISRRDSIIALAKRGVAYKAEIDLSDEGTIKMLDAYVRLQPWRTLRITVGQMRVPFTIDTHRSPHAQYFANRSFIAKQVGNVRDVGAMIGYTWLGLNDRPLATLDAGLFNGSGLTAQKNAWHRDVNFSARLQAFPLASWCLTASAQRSRVASDSLHYMSYNAGTFFHNDHWHAEAEYLCKTYEQQAFRPVHSVDAFICYTHDFRKADEKSFFFRGMSYLLRYDFMTDHTDGSKGFSTGDSASSFSAGSTPTLAVTDYSRHRLTAGITLHILRYKRLLGDLRLNYELYWYPAGGTPKDSEQSKLVAELMLHF